MQLLQAFIFGFTLALSIGPILLIIVNNGVFHGSRAALSSALGAALGDFTFAVFSFICGQHIIKILIKHQYTIHIIASLILIIFGFWLLLGTFNGYTKNKASTLRVYDLKTTYFLTIINPLAIIAFTAFSSQLALQFNISYMLQLAFFVFLGSLFIQVIFALLASSMHILFTRYKLIYILNFISGLGIVIFGVMGIT